jgi:hypothetical protein
MFTSRPRFYARTPDSADLGKQTLWATMNAMLYKLGGIIFVAGASVAYLWNIEDKSGYTTLVSGE